MRQLPVPGHGVAATATERAATLPGDEIVAGADVVMDRAFTLDALPAVVWPWLVQLGKARAGWYLPRVIERWLPPGRRAARVVGQDWQRLRVGDVVPDYGGPGAAFTVAVLDPGAALVYSARRGAMDLTWALTIRADTAPGAAAPRSRVHLRLRLGSVRRRWLAETGGELLDLLTIAGMAAGLRERLSGDGTNPQLPF